MSVLVGARERTQSFGTALANTTLTTCYTNNGQQAAKGLVVHVGNENGAAVVVLIYWYDSTAAVSYCIGGESVADDRGYKLDLDGLRLDKLDEIRAIGASGVDVVVTVTEFQGPG